MSQLDDALVGWRSTPRCSEDSVMSVLKNGKGRDMKSFKDKMSEAEMRAVAQYIRTLANAT